MKDINKPNLWKNIFTEVDKEKDVEIRSQGKVNIARSNRLQKDDPEYIRKHKAGLDKFFSSDESKKRNAKISKFHQARLATPEYRQFLKDNAKRLANDPEWLQKCKDAQNNRSEEHKKNQRKAVYKTMQTKQWKEKVKANAKLKQRAIVTPYGEFEGLSEFKRKTGWGFANKNKQMPHLYYYKDVGPKKPKLETVYYTPYCVYNNSAKAWNLAKQNGDEYALKLASGNFAHCWFKKMAKEDPDNYYKCKEPKREWNLEKK
jgi:hypothetical protein